MTSLPASATGPSGPGNDAPDTDTGARERRRLVAALALAAQRCWWRYPDAATRGAITDAARRLPLDPLDPRLLTMLVQAAPT